MSENESIDENASTLDVYILVQPIVSTYWVGEIKEEGEDRSPKELEEYPQDEVFTDLTEALTYWKTVSDENDYPMKITTSPYEAVTNHNEETMIKVFMAMQKMDYKREEALKIIKGLQNEGILFRERAE